MLDLALSNSYRQLLNFSDELSLWKNNYKNCWVSKKVWWFGVKPGCFFYKTPIAQVQNGFEKRRNTADTSDNGILRKPFVIEADYSSKNDLKFGGRTCVSLAIDNFSFSIINCLREKSIGIFDEMHKTSFTLKSKLWCFSKSALAWPDFT